MTYSHRAKQAFEAAPGPSCSVRCDNRAQQDFLTRRHLCGLLLAGSVIVAAQPAAAPAAQAAPTVGQARAFIRQAGDSMIALLNEPGDWNAKRHKLEEVIAEKMDVPGIARFSLGRFWNVASNTQREELTRLLPMVLLGELARSVGILEGITFTIDRSIQHEAWVDVWTTVYRPGNARRRVDWLVGLPDGKLRIIDILAEGSSLRITQREDLAGFMAQHHHSIELLLDELKRKAAETAGA